MKTNKKTAPAANALHALGTIASVLDSKGGNVELPVKLTISPDYFVILLEVAFRKGQTIEEVIQGLIESEELCEAVNDLRGGAK